MVTLFSSPLFSYKFMWYDGYKTLDHGCLFNFVVGNRGCGKSYWAKKWAIRDFLKNGKQFIYLRRFDTEHAGIKKYFDDIEANEEFPGVEFSVSKQNILKINGMDAGYPLALTKAKIQKSVSFPDVNKIIFDEFLLDKGYQHYLPDECVAFLELYETVARMREVTVMFLSNSISTVNPYFIYFDIQLPYNSNIYKRGDILLQVVRDDEFVEAKKQTRFGKLIAGTAYGNYAIENTFLRDNNNFIRKRTGKCHCYFVFIISGVTYGVWVNENKDFFICEDYDKDMTPYVITKDDHTESSYYISNFRSSYYCKYLMAAFETGSLYFTNLRCKSATFNLLRMVIR